MSVNSIIAFETADSARYLTIQEKIQESRCNSGMLSVHSSQQAEDFTQNIRILILGSLFSC